jgi:hypothetical protein
MYPLSRYTPEDLNKLVYRVVNVLNMVLKDEVMVLSLLLAQPIEAVSRDPRQSLALS